MVVKFKDGKEVTLQKINDIKEYRGFWILINGEYFINNVCSSNLKNPPNPEETGYSAGFEFTGNIIAHLYNKVLNNETLSKNEQKEFYEKIDLTNPIIRTFGKVISFKDILYKHTNIQFWTIKPKMNEKEKQIYKQSAIFTDNITDLIEQ